MATKSEVDVFLSDFHQKMKIFDIIFRDDRGKNKQALIDLDIRPNERNHIIESLTSDDYCEGPTPELLYKTTDMWIFGTQVGDTPIYIKISMGAPSTSVICISFHTAEFPLHYPLKGASL